jgi:hypothetical protein
MITVIKVNDGSYNLIGTSEGMFILQGNLTADELKQLVYEAKKELKK